MFTIGDKHIQIYADGGNLDSIIETSKSPLIDGLTTNPTLLSQAGVTNYMQFVRAAVKFSHSKPISIEVHSEDPTTIYSQALKLSVISPHVYVKVPIVSSQGLSLASVINDLSSLNVKLNITSILTHDQIREAADLVSSPTPSILSIFAGRIADTGVDPVPFFDYAHQCLSSKPSAQTLWASTREIYNLYQAAHAGVDIITVPYSLLPKLSLYQYDLHQLSVDTVKMFIDDASMCSYYID